MSSRPWLQQHSVLILITFFSECILKPNIWAFSGIANLIRSTGHGGKSDRRDEECPGCFVLPRDLHAILSHWKKKSFVIFISSKLKLFTKVRSLGSEKKTRYFRRVLVVMEIKHEITFHLNYHCDFISFLMLMSGILVKND